jgi:hypothetical protein
MIPSMTFPALLLGRFPLAGWLIHRYGTVLYVLKIDWDVGSTQAKDC